MSECLAVPTTLTAKERDKIDRLRRRAEWLRHRTATSRIDLSYDKAELAALEWAISFIENASRPVETDTYWDWIENHTR